MKEVKKHKLRKRKVSGIITLLLLISILMFFGIIFYINVLPIFYTILAFILALAINFGLLFLNFSKKKGLRLIGDFLSILIISILVYITSYLFNTLGFLFNVTDGDYLVKNYNVVVLKNSNYNSLEDLNNKDVGISETITDDTLNKVQENINKKTKVNYKNYESSDILTNALINKEIDAAILENSELSILKENKKENFDKLKVIYEIEIKNDIASLKEAVNINNEPFNIYISGIDTYGKINSSSRSDVNILLTINPKTEKILMTWIPRDYYVYINDSTYKDKLTHAGIYGIDSSIYAISNLLDVKVNYYVKVNFTSVIEIVDLLGGVTVYNNEEFTTIENVTFRQGNLNLSGKDALAFVRERKNLKEGDVGRGKHQILVLEALMHKAMSKDIIKNYNKLLQSLDDAFVTNMPQNAMLGFIKKEIQSPRNWQMESNILNGTDAYEYTYSYKSTELYVMKPNEESVNMAQSKIKDMMKN